MGNVWRHIINSRAVVIVDGLNAFDDNVLPCYDKQVVQCNNIIDKVFSLYGISLVIVLFLFDFLFLFFSLVPLVVQCMARGDGPCGRHGY